MTTKTHLLSDSIQSLKVWRVWLFLGKQDVKARFRRSLIGPLWLFINMALFVGGVGVVYGLMFGQPMEEFLPFLTTGFIIWGFIVSSLTESGFAFINAEGYIKQFSFPKQIYLLRALVVYVVILMIGLFALIPVQIFFKHLTLLSWFFAIPGFILLLLAALGHIVIFAYLSTRFRDLPHAMGGILQILFFVTPIIFPVKILVERKLDFVYKYNPLHYLIEIVRYPIMNGEFAAVVTYFYAGIYVITVWIVAVLVAKHIDTRVVYLL